MIKHLSRFSLVRSVSPQLNRYTWIGIVMRATVRGLEIMPVWCSPLRHSWTVQCWTRAEQREWICTLTGWVGTITSSATQPDSLLLFCAWLMAAYKVFVFIMDAVFLVDHKLSRSETSALLPLLSLFFFFLEMKFNTWDSQASDR